ncbi:MAG: serine/threonine phosphatase [Phormidesmis sp.]
MLLCANCQFANPIDHNFCQRCGAPLLAQPLLQVRLMPFDQLELAPDTYLPADDSQPSEAQLESRYQVSTVLSPGRAYVVDSQAEVRSPLQQQLFEFASADTVPTLETLQSISTLPPAAYPYLLLKNAAPRLYDTWQCGETTLVITQEPPTTTPLVKAFSAAIDPLQPVYWTHLLTELWAALEPTPQWRSSLLQADNLGITADQSLYVHKFTPPGSPRNQPVEDQPSQFASQLSNPQLSDLQAFLKALLAQPHRGEVATLRQIRQLILAVTSAQTLGQLKNELAVIGEALLTTPAATTPRTSPLSHISTFAPPAALPARDSLLDPSLSNTSNPKSDMAVVDPSTDPLESELLNDFPDSSESTGDSTTVLPMKLAAIEDVGRTDVGRLRDHNEDCFFIASSYRKKSGNHTHSLKAHCMYVLCDGMGGHEGGEIASQLAAQTLADYFEEHWPSPWPSPVQVEATEALKEEIALPDEETIIAAVKLANQAIYDTNEKEQRAGHERMGTTLVLLLLQGTSAVVAHVGDSRLYQHTRRVGLRQVTTDHEVGQREIQRGIDPAIAYDRPDAYQLTQALGPRDQESLSPSVAYLHFSEDTLLLLCSDGLSDNNLVEDYLESHIDPILREKKGLAAGMDDLIKLANEVNGHDNITGIAVRLKISPDFAPDFASVRSES